MWRKPFLVFLFLVVCISCGQGLRRAVGGSSGSDVGEGGGGDDGGGGGGGGGGGEGGGPTGDFSVSPTSGPQRTVITLTGTGFAAPLSITVGGVTCRSPTVVSPTEVWCVTGAIPLGSADIVVTQGGETSSLEAGFTNTAYLYVAASTEDRIYQYQISASGGLTPLTPAFATAGDGVGFLFYPRHSALFFALNSEMNTIGTYTFDTDGAIWELTGSPDNAGTSPFAATLDGMRVFQATPDGSTDVTTYIYQLDDVLSSGGQAGSGRVPGKTIITPDGLSVYTKLSNGSASLAGFQVTSLVALEEHGSSPYTSSTASGDIAASNDDKFIFQIDMSVPRLHYFPRNTTSGELSAPGSVLLSANGNSLLFVHPTRNCLYVLDSDASSGFVMTWDATTGEPTALSSSTFTAVSNPKSLAFDPGGNFAFVANAAGGNVSRFSVASDCRMTHLGFTSAGAVNEGVAVR